MGKSVAPKYRIETRGRAKDSWVTYAAWNSKFYGRPTVRNLEQFRQKLNRSFLYSGVNSHVPDAFGSVPYYSRLRIVNQFTREVVCETCAPMFEIV